MSSTFEADYTVRWELPAYAAGTLDQKGTFSYDTGKANLQRESYWMNPDTKESGVFLQRFAFNGEVLSTLDTSPDAPGPSGYITSIDTEIAGEFTPHTLLGGSLMNTGVRSLANNLKKASEVKISTLENGPNGEPCVFVTCLVPVGLVGGGASQTVDIAVQLWLSPEHDYRLIQSKHYRDATTDPEKLVTSLEDVELEKIDGIWIPVSARQRWFTFTGGELSETASQLLEVSEWRFTDELDPALFTVKYPRGALVIDERIDTHYRVGEPPREVRSELSSLLTNEAKEPPIEDEHSSQVAVGTVKPEHVTQPTERPFRRWAGGAAWVVAGVLGIVVAMGLARRSRRISAK